MQYQVAFGSFTSSSYIARTIRLQNFKNFCCCICPPGSLEMEKNKEKSKLPIMLVSVGEHVFTCIAHGLNSAKKIAIMSSKVTVVGHQNIVLNRKLAIVLVSVGGTSPETGYLAGFSRGTSDIRVRPGRTHSSSCMYVSVQYDQRFLWLVNSLIIIV